jgi:AcrR family transcriptional regulator
MARPTQISDEKILDAAEMILARDGVGAFSLASVAREVGITRAAITFRFESAHKLMVMAAERGVTRYIAEMRALEIERSGDGLLAFARHIGSRCQSPSALSHFLSQSHARLHYPDLAKLENARGEAYTEAIARAMPVDPSARQDAVAIFGAHLTGTLHAWAARGEPSAAVFLEQRAAMLLDAMGIEHSGPVAGRTGQDARKVA